MTEEQHLKEEIEQKNRELNQLKDKLKHIQEKSAKEKYGIQDDKYYCIQDGIWTVYTKGSSVSPDTFNGLQVKRGISYMFTMLDSSFDLFVGERNFVGNIEVEEVDKDYINKYIDQQVKNQKEIMRL